MLEWPLKAEAPAGRPVACRRRPVCTALSTQANHTIIPHGLGEAIIVWEDQRGGALKQPNNPLHGVTLEMMLRQMVDRFGWEGLARDIPINCFLVDPSMASALKYLRKAPRARQEVEKLYLVFVSRRRGPIDPGPNP